MSGEVVDELELERFTATLRHTENAIPPWRNTTLAHRRYSLQVKNKETGDAESFRFWGSEREMREGEHSTARDALEQVLLNATCAEAYDDIDDFAENQGYELGEIEISEIQNQWEAVNETRDKLQEIGMSHGDIMHIAVEIEE